MTTAKGRVVLALDDPSARDESRHDANDVPPHPRCPRTAGGRRLRPDGRREKVEVQGRTGCRCEVPPTPTKWLTGPACRPKILVQYGVLTHQSKTRAAGRHLHRVTLEPPGDDRALAALVGDIAGRPLRRDRPLWEMWVVEGLAAGRVALVVKMHHATIDGVSGANVMGQLLDLEPVPQSSPVPEAAAPGRSPRKLELLGRGLASRLAEPMDLIRLVPATAIRLASTLWRLERPGETTAGTGAVHGATNRIQCHDHPTALDPSKRLHAVAAANAQAKEIHKTAGADTLMRRAEHFWLNAFGLGARLYSALHVADRHSVVHNLILSNVPGPPVPLYSAGARPVGLYPLGPITDGAALNVTVLSQEDRIGFGIVTCPDLVPEVWDLAYAVPEALDELFAATRGSRCPRMPTPRSRSSTTPRRRPLTPSMPTTRQGPR